jgi:hypothetical protein
VCCPPILRLNAIRHVSSASVCWPFLVVFHILPCVAALTVGREGASLLGDGRGLFPVFIRGVYVPHLPAAHTSFGYFTHMLGMFFVLLWEVSNSSSDYFTYFLASRSSLGIRIMVDSHTYYG